MSDLDTANPKFRAWAATQTLEVRNAIAAKLEEISAMPDISNNTVGRYARLTRLMAFCAETYGYS